jgi:hypothetical protein
VNDDDADAHPEASPEPEPEASPGPEAESEPLAMRVFGAVWRVRQWLIPVVLSAAAIGLHFHLNVPDEPVEPRTPQGAAAKKAAAKRKAAAAAVAKVFEPRAGPELDRLLETYEQAPFEREPVLGKWARSTQTLLNKAVVLARKEAFAGAPEEPRVSVNRTQCRTVRCRIVLRSPFAHELQMLSDRLQRIETGGQSIWRRYEQETTQAPDEDHPREDHHLQITVVLIADDIEPDSLELGPPLQTPEE